MLSIELTYCYDLNLNESRIYVIVRINLFSFIIVGMDLILGLYLTESVYYLIICITLCRCVFDS